MTDQLTRSQIERLLFIEDLLFWTGRVGNAPIRARFDVSRAQAAQDIGRYRNMQAERGVQILYEPGDKVFLAPPNLEPVMSAQSFERFLAIARQEEVILGAILDVAEMLPPSRLAPVDVARALVNAVASGNEVEVSYVSISSGSSRRWLAPHAFAHDGMRFHVRAFDHKRGGFGDFVLGRIEAVHSRRRREVDIDADTDWFEVISLELIPNPALSPDQQHMVMREYAFEGGTLTHRVRRAMLLYLNSRMFLHSSLAGMADQQKYRQLVPRDQTVYDRLIDQQTQSQQFEGPTISAKSKTTQIACRLT